MPNVFQNLVSCKRVFRELRMLCFFKHDNVRGGATRSAGLRGSPAGPHFPVLSQVLSALDILQPPQIDCFEEMYPSGPRRRPFLRLSVFSASPWPLPQRSHPLRPFLLLNLSLQPLDSAGRNPPPFLAVSRRSALTLNRPDT